MGSSHYRNCLKLGHLCSYYLTKGRERFGRLCFADQSTSRPMFVKTATCLEVDRGRSCIKGSTKNDFTFFHKRSASSLQTRANHIRIAKSRYKMEDYNSVCSAGADTIPLTALESLALSPFLPFTCLRPPVRLSACPAAVSSVRSTCTELPV